MVCTNVVHLYNFTDFFFLKLDIIILFFTPFLSLSLSPYTSPIPPGTRVPVHLACTRTRTLLAADTPTTCTRLNFNDIKGNKTHTDGKLNKIKVQSWGYRRSRDICWLEWNKSVGHEVILRKLFCSRAKPTLRTNQRRAIQNWNKTRQIEQIKI